MYNTKVIKYANGSVSVRYYSKVFRRLTQQEKEQRKRMKDYRRNQKQQELDKKRGES